ncbi:MAG: hypothetical protein VX726_11935 [Planctomycetota bacterium]|nr:hypothetical protein [Planctomycetota bacterium]
MTRIPAWFLLAALAFTTSATSAPAASATEEPIDAGTIEAMVECLVAELETRHDAVRHWEPENYPKNDDGSLASTAQPTGRTALVALALLEAGVPAQSPELSKALEWMAANPADGTYAIAVRLMVWCRLPERYRELAEAELARLVGRFSPEAGGWDYIPTPRAGFVDQSITQYAMQGIADAHAAGLKIPPRLVDLVRNRFLGVQTADGGWGYKNADDPPRGSLTAAGLASLALCERIKPSSGRTRQAVDRSIAGAIDWLDAMFERDTNPGHDAGDYWLFYYLHSVERAGRATGVRRFRGQDWLDACARTILDRMIQGSADTGFSTKWNPSNEKMAFALFVLHRGLESVPIGFFDTTGALPVNDELGLASKVLSDSIEKSVGWTRLELADSAATWHQVPVVVVRGRGNDPWLDDPDSPEATRLFAHLENGGIVVPMPADRGRFNVEFLALVQERFPQLEKSKVDSKADIRRDPTPWRGRADILGTPIRTWVLSAPRMSLGSDATAKDQVETANMLAAICIAESESVLPPRAPRPPIPEAPASKTIAVERFEYDGAWNPEPSALLMLSNELRRSPMRLDLDARDASEAVLWLTGIDEKDAAAVDLARVAERLGEGRKLLLECVHEDFTSAMTARLLEQGWTLGAAPANTPPGSARLSGPNGEVGILVTAEVTRSILGRPTDDGVSMPDLAKLVRMVADLEPLGG